MATQFDPTQYFLGSGLGVGRYNQPYRPKIQDILARMNRPEITGMPGQGVYIDQMSYPQYVSRTGPDIFYQKRRDPLGANLYPNVPGMGFTPSAGLMDMGEMQPLPSQSEDALIAAAGARFKTPNELGFMPGGSREPVVVEDIMAQDNPNYLAEPAQEAGAAPRRTLGLLGDMFGGASALDEYMTPEQRAQLQNQGVMAAAMQLLSASGPSRTPVGLGQALGQAYGAGQQGYTAAQDTLLKSMTMKQKMDEAKAKKDMQANVSGFLSQKAPEGVDANAFKAQQYMKLADVYAATNPDQANKFFDMAQKLMPVDKPVGEPFRAADGKFYQRTELGNVKPFGGGTVTPAAKPTGKPEQQLVDGKVQMVQYFDDGTFKPLSGVSQVAKPSGQPQMQVVNGVPTMMQYFDDGTSKPLAGVSQYNAPSSLVTNLEYVGGKSLANTGPAGLAELEKSQKATAANISIDTGQKARNVPVNKDIIDRLSAKTEQAETANQTLANIDRVLPALDKAITGPLADYRTTILRVGQFMGVAGKNADEILSNTQNVVQGLAQQELNAASYTKGQGTLTGPEREMLKRSAAGDQNMSAAELRTALVAAQKMAQFRLDDQAKFLEKTTRLPGMEEYRDLYTIDRYQPAAPAAAGAAGRPPLSSIIKPRGAR